MPLPSRTPSSPSACSSWSSRCAALEEQVTVIGEDHVVHQELADVQDALAADGQRLDERLKALEQTLGEQQPAR